MYNPPLELDGEQVPTYLSALLGSPLFPLSMTLPVFSPAEINPLKLPIGDPDELYFVPFTVTVIGNISKPLAKKISYLP